MGYKSYMFMKFNARHKVSSIMTTLYLTLCMVSKCLNGLKVSFWHKVAIKNSYFLLDFYHGKGDIPPPKISGN